MALKILFVIDGLGSGGAERSLGESLPFFKENGIDPLIVCFHKRMEGIERSIVERGFDVRVIGTKSWVQRIRQLREIISQEKPEILHSSLFASNLAGRIASLGKPVKVLNSLVNTPYVRARRLDSQLNSGKFYAVRMVDSWTARACTDHFHAVSHTVKEHAIEAMNLPAERISVVERGRDPVRLGYPSDERRRQARRNLELSENAEVLVNVGRQEFQKGQTHLLQAIAALGSHRPNLLLLMAGRRGAASAELDHLYRQLDLGDKVRFLGFREDVPEILAVADLFVFPSLFEGMAGALIEAMALGLPIVASDLPVQREVVEEGKNALLVQPSAPDELRAGIESLLQDRQRMAKYGQRSREIFEERFTLERSATRMIELYHTVAEKVH